MGSGEGGGADAKLLSDSPEHMRECYTQNRFEDIKFNEFVGSAGFYTSCYRCDNKPRCEQERMKHNGFV